MFVEVVADLGIDVEIVVFLCSLILYFILHKSRKAQQSKRQELKAKSMGKPQNESDASEGICQSSEARTERDELDARYAQIEKNMHLAFESEDLFQALRCWYAMKKFKQCSPRYLSQIIKTMQSCNKTDEFIVMELRDYLLRHQKQRTRAIVNDVLEPLARQLDSPHLVKAIVDMSTGLKIYKDSRTYEILLTMYSAKQDAKASQELIEEMTSQGIEFTPCALVAVMTMALQLGKLDVALKAFVKLKASWDVRSTWAVSPFALQQHKADTLTKLVELSCRKRKLADVLPLLEDMAVPEQVTTIVTQALATLSDVEVTLMSKVMGDSKSSRFAKCLDTRSKALLRSRQAKVDSDASTSEGSRSDSEDDSPLQYSCTA